MNVLNSETSILDNSISDYIVLARKYRPQDFSHLIGQEALVQTLSNAMANNRLAHAFILTGVRGIGKTTTARIIAKAINCTAVRSTIDPCGICTHCVGITEGRDMDVIEMDAASHTGVDHIREIIEAVKYKPVAAKYKIYIIDEVHMLSTASFNALLKTLEEPPAHVKFIFATTEIKKVPITVLSRCQRFDLRRIMPDVLFNHLKDVATQEHAVIDDDALRVLVRAADGSVRDGLSLLDRAISHGSDGVDLQKIQQMLGLADRSVMLECIECLVKGQAQQALHLLTDLYQKGAEPLAIVEDLMEASHWLTRMKVAADTISREDSPGFDFDHSRRLAGELSLGILSRLWQMLLKGSQEIPYAPSALAAAEMVFLRITTTSRLPSPEEALQLLKQQESQPQPVVMPAAKASLEAQKKNLTSNILPETITPSPVEPVSIQIIVASVAPILDETVPPSVDTQQSTHDIQSVDDVLQLLQTHNESLLIAELRHDFAVVRVDMYEIEISNLGSGKNTFAKRLQIAFKEHLQQDWAVITQQPNRAAQLVQDDDMASLKSYAQQQQDFKNDIKQQWQQSDITQQIQNVFPQASLVRAEKVVQIHTSNFTSQEDAEDTAH